MLICGQFIAKYLNLWSTLVFVRFEKLNFSDFWGPLNLRGPSKKSQLLDSWPLSLPLKTRPWMNLFKIFVLYLHFMHTLITLLSVPVLLNDLVWNFSKNLYYTYRMITKQPVVNSLTYCSIKQPGLNFVKYISIN